MNKVTGTIIEMNAHEGLSLVKVKANDTVFTSIVLDDQSTTDYLITGKVINIFFKETEVIISKDKDPAISIQNRIPCTIKAIDIGAILGQVTLLFNETVVRSIITGNACRQLDLKVNDHVLALIKTNEISLSPHD